MCHTTMAGSWETSPKPYHLTAIKSKSERALIVLSRQFWTCLRNCPITPRKSHCVNHRFLLALSVCLWHVVLSTWTTFWLAPKLTTFLSPKSGLSLYDSLGFKKLGIIFGYLFFHLYMGELKHC